MSHDSETFRKARPGEIPAQNISASRGSPELVRGPRLPATKSQVFNLVTRNHKIDIVLDVAKAMGSVHSLDELLDLIAESSRQVADAERCTLFIHDREAGELWAKIAHGLDQTIRVKVGEGIAGHVADTRQVLQIPDAYQDPRFNPAFDKQTGYRTRNILCVPMLDNEGEVTGVIQVLNKQNQQFFSEEDQELLLALGGQAAVSVENAILHQGIEDLLASFIKASVYAIEARDPTTHGHSERVAELTLGLADTVGKETRGPYQNLLLGTEALHELRYAALLHDFGKVGVRENVLLKSKKLYPQQFELLQQRFDFVRRSLQYEALKKKYALAKAAGEAAVAVAVARIDQELEQALLQLDDYFLTVVTCNEPSILAEGDFAKLQDLGAFTFTTWQETQAPLLRPDEVLALSVRKGSLDEKERHEIESHVTFTYRFLSRIQWTGDLKRVPDIAHAHHEKLNGKGYPRGIAEGEIPVQSRMMAIADIYDALTARDRPYKKAVPQTKALDILHMEARSGSIDAELLRIFVQGQVYKLVE